MLPASLFFSPCTQTLTLRFTRSVRLQHESHDEVKVVAPIRYGLKDLSFHELPDRNIITVGAKRVHCAEVLYQPSFTDKEACGIHDISFQSNMKCDVYTCMTMPYCQVARPCSNGMLSA